MKNEKNAFIKRICVAISVFGGIQQATAAITLCDVVRAFPRRSESFDDVVTRVNALGCVTEKNTSAHINDWECDVGQKDSLWIRAIRLDTPSTTLMWIDADQEKINMDQLSECAPLKQEFRPYFEPKSVVDIGRLAFTLPSAKYRFINDEFEIYHIGWKPFTYLVGDTDRLHRGIEKFRIGKFGISSDSYKMARVEVAGVNIVTSPANAVIEGLTKRGSKKISSNDENDINKISMTPPVGLDGVAKIDIVNINDHIVKVRYVTKDLSSYESILRSIEEKYGASIKIKASGENCYYRKWDSLDGDNSKVLGKFCNSGESFFDLFNALITDQAQAALKAITASLKSSGPSGPSIDKDNF